MWFRRGLRYKNRDPLSEKRQIKPQEAFRHDVRASGMTRQECRIARGTALGASEAVVDAAIPRRPDKKHRDFLGMTGCRGIPRLRSLHSLRSLYCAGHLWPGPRGCAPFTGGVQGKQGRRHDTKPTANRRGIPRLRDATFAKRT